MARLSGAVAGAILAACACAAHAGPVQPGHEQGLGLLPRDIPDELKRAEADPYAMPPEPVCGSIDQELATLEKILGPDVDATQPKENKAADLIGGAVRGAIPYRSWIRKITGAERQDKRRDRDLLAAWERRGYLKGLARQRECVGPAGATQASANDAETAAQPAVTIAPAPLPPAAPAFSDDAYKGVPAAETIAPPEPDAAQPAPLPPAQPAYAPPYDETGPAPGR